MSKPKGDPRNGHRYRKVCMDVLLLSDICHLCGHGGARTVDHKISVRVWFARYGTYEGVNHPSNLAPAHGTRGNRQNRCPTCHKLCNQSKGARIQVASPRSRRWARP